MKFRKLVISSAVSLALMSGLSHGFGLPKVPKVPGLPVASGSGDAVNADAVDAFIATGAASNKLISDSRVILATALSTKEERAKIKSQQAQLKQGLDAKDKKAIQAAKEFNASLDAQLQAKAGDEAAVATLKNLTAEQSKLVLDSMMNLAYGVMLQQQQVTAGQSLVSAVSANPMLVTKLPAIKDTVTTMTGNISGTVGYLAKFPALLKGMEVSVMLPKSVDEKPQQLAESALDDFFKSEPVSQ